MAIKDNLQPFWGFNVQGITKDDGSANDAFISSLQSELDKTELDLYSSKLETYLETAEERWLDYWGRWLGLHRDNRSDDDYRTALINHVLHERNTISAIKEALADFLKVNQDNVYIYEPWRDMFIWNASHYNTHKFFTDPYYRYAVIDIQIEGGYSEVVNEIVNLFRPAGVYWVVTSLVNVLNANAPILDLSLPTNKIIESSDTDYANFTQTNSAYLTSKLDLATYVGDPFNYNKDNLNGGKQYMTSNSSYNPVVFIGSNKEEQDSTIKTTGGGVNLLQGTRDFSGINIQGGKVAVTNGGESFQAAFGTQNSSQFIFDLVNFNSIPLEKDTDYTASFWVKTSEDTDIWSFLYDSGSNGVYANEATVNHSTTDYTRIVVHFHNGNNNATPTFRPARINKVGVTVWIYGCMIEKGTVAHPWSPNPSDSIYDSWLQTQQQNELAITSQQLKQQLGTQITSKPTVISSIDSQAKSFTVDQTQTSILGGIDLLNYLTVYKQAVKPSNQTDKQFILANLATSNTQRLELVLQNQDNLDLTQDVRLELYDYNLHLWIKPVVDYEVHSDYTIFKVSLPSLAPYLSDGGNFMFQVWPTTPNITTLSVNYLGYLFNAPSDIITLANSDETFTMETN